MSNVKRDNQGIIICEHNKRQHRCVLCHGNQICEHDRERSGCKECRGSAICKHLKTRRQCRYCGGLRIVASSLFKNAKVRANRSGLPFSITIEDVLNLLKNDVCPVFGIRYNFYSGKATDESATLDKILPILGYTKENTIIISHLANRIKSNAKSRQVRRVADWMEQQTSLENDI